MKKIEAIVMAAALVMTGSCGNKQAQPMQEKESSPQPVVNVNRDSTVYGVCGDGSAMNTLQLITDVGDTLTLSVADANEKSRVLGGFQSGDRMAVILRNRHVASLVINQSALLGDWVMPNPLDGSSEMGIRIKEGGIAESIDQPSINYRSWRLFNGKLEIVAVREGGGDEVETNLYDIVSIGTDSLIYKDTEDIFEYSRYRSNERKVNIKLEESSFDDFLM